VLLRESGQAWRIRDVLDRVRVVEGDLARPDSYARALDELRPEAVAHLAWGGVAGRERNEPAQVANIEATVRLLQKAVDAGAGTFIGLGSQAEYGPCPARIPETAATAPTTLYGASKLSAALVARAFCALRGVRFAWMRLFAAYGPMDDPGWLIPHLCLTLLSGKSPSMTAAEQRWDYLFAPDAAEAIARVVLEPAAEGFFNLGSGQPVPVRSIAEQVRDLVDPALETGFGKVPYRPDQVMHMEADTARLEQATGWHPATPLATGLERTVAWFRNHRSRHVVQ